MGIIALLFLDKRYIYVRRYEEMPPKKSINLFPSTLDDALLDML